jgi:hypothetical protein
MTDQDGQNGEPPEEGLVLWAWVAQEKGESGVARLQQAWIPLGTINLAGFSQEVLADQRLLQALQEQADKDGQTVRLVKFVKAEEVMAVRPRQGTTGPQAVGEAPGRT